MAIEQKWWPWKPSLYTQYRIRIINELRLAQRHEHCKELRHQIDRVKQDIIEILRQMTPIDFTQIDQKLNSCITLCQTEEKHTLKEYYRIKKQLIHLTPKLLIGNAYLHARCNELSIKTQSINNKKKRKRLKLTIEQQWKKGIGDAYRKLQIQRDKQDLFKHNQTVNISIPIESLPIIHDYPLDEQPIITENIINEINEHEFIPPLPPTLIDEPIIPFQTPPISRRLTPSDPFQLAVDDTIVKPHRLINKTLGNISHMSFHIEPDQCSSPKPDEKKKKTKLKKLMLPLPPPPPPPPLFSSTAIFDTHAFFTQTNTKTKKQKKKIDIARQPIIMTINDTRKKRTRTKKSSPYDFQDDDISTSSRSKGTKLLTDDIITARFAKNSHYQSHQTSMASTKSSKSQHKSNEREHKKKKKNILGIGTSSPSISSTNLTLSPGRLSTDDDYDMKSSLSRRHNRTKTTNKSKRTRVK
ncbi:unnamed protein product [Rotaria sp. Silwood2]|nr:unnamed protein product [Rotaria sp. Silwood2]